MSTGHSITRTSPYGEKFVGTCSLCGKTELTFASMKEECENQRGLTQDEALMEALDTPAALPTSREGSAS